MSKMRCVNKDHILETLRKIIKNNNLKQNIFFPRRFAHFYIIGKFSKRTISINCSTAEFCNVPKKQPKLTMTKFTTLPCSNVLIEISRWVKRRMNVHCNYFYIVMTCYIQCCSNTFTKHLKFWMQTMQ